MEGLLTEVAGHGVHWSHDVHAGFSLCVPSAGPGFSAMSRYAMAFTHLFASLPYTRPLSITQIPISFCHAMLPVVLIRDTQPADITYFLISRRVRLDGALCLTAIRRAAGYNRACCKKLLDRRR